MSSFNGFLYRRSAESFIGSCDDVERSDLYRVERFTSEALHSLSSTGFRCCCYHWTRGASARTVSQEVTENEDILKFGSLIVLSNTQEAGSSAALTMFVCTVLAHGLACVVVDSEVVQLCIPWFDIFLFSALQVSCMTSGWYSMGLVCRPCLP